MITCVDFDDLHERNHKLDRLWELKAANPRFRCTAFAVPGLGSMEFWASLPRWIELAVHGWLHPNSYEASLWSRENIEGVLEEDVVLRYFVNGWKSPGWMTAPAVYEVLAERGWWIADQHLADPLRPPMRTYLYEDGTNWHGHIQDWGSNGIEETWPQLLDHVSRATEFRFASELAR